MEPIPVFQGDIVEFTHENERIRGVVELSGLDADVEMEDMLEGEELSKEKAKIFSYPKHELIEKQMEDLKLLDRAVLPGDIVRRNGKAELGTVLSLESKATVRVLETNNHLSSISCMRLVPMVKFNEGDRVEYNGWLGSIRELDEDRIIIETEDGVINFDDDEDAKIDPEFRFLSLRGIYEHIDEWRRNEEDSGIFLNQQIIGNFAPDGGLQIGKIVQIENGDCEISWVASGNRKEIPEPKCEWSYDELKLLNAPWCLNINHSEVNAPSLGSRFTLKINSDEAYLLNIKKEPIPKKDDIEVEITFKDFLTENNFGFSEEEAGPHPWIHVKVGKFECIIYEDQSVPKYTNKKNESFNDLIQEILFPESPLSDEEMNKNLQKLITDYKKGSEIIEIKTSHWVYRPKDMTTWTKSRPKMADIENESSLTDILGKLRGQGHINQTFIDQDIVSVEITEIETDIKVQWQTGEISIEPSINLTPALHINEHDFSPGDFVVRKDTNRDLNEYGCIVRADNKERLIDLIWDSGKNENVSTFDIEDHPDYKNIRVGELVVFSASSKPLDADSEFSGVGTVDWIDTNGKLKVKWSCGLESTVKPNNVISESILFGDAFDDMNFGSNDDDGFGLPSDDENVEGGEDGDSDGWISCDSSSSGIDVKEINEKLKEKMVSKEELESEKELRQKLVDMISGNADRLTEENELLVEENQELVAGQVEDDLNGNQSVENPQLSTLDFPDSTHSYLNKSNAQTMKRSFLKVYQSELKRLKSSLPKGIHFCTYESRVDLMSFMIEGPAETPYEHCLFAFDLCLAPDYPMTPPKVTYKSMISQKINPNLYETGNVCLSLLGTWSGKEDSEEWTCNSNLLQLVVSLQGMVLTGSPYFNEAGYDKQIGTSNGQLNSKNYNELVIVRLCDHIVASIRNPPSPFKEFYQDYYFDQGHLAEFMQQLKQMLEGDKKPKYDLLPLSKGCHRALESQLRILTELESTQGKNHKSPMV